jgi:hypothetical protein
MARKRQASANRSAARRSLSRATPRTGSLSQIRSATSARREPARADGDTRTRRARTRRAPSTPMPDRTASARATSAGTRASTACSRRREAGCGRPRRRHRPPCAGHRTTDTALVSCRKTGRASRSDRTGRRRARSHDPAGHMQGSDGSCARRGAAARSHAASELARPAAWSRRGRQSRDSTPSPRGGAGGSRAVAGPSRPRGIARTRDLANAGRASRDALRGGCQCALPRVRAVTALDVRPADSMAATRTP